MGLDLLPCCMAWLNSGFGKGLGQGLDKRIAVFTLLAAFSACKKTESVKAPSSPEELRARGKLVYSTNCATCHNPDPSMAGSIGPAIAGSSRELIEARVLKAEYPPGYKPKAATHTMPPLPYMKNDLPAIEAFLNSKAAP